MAPMSYNPLLRIAAGTTQLSITRQSELRVTGQVVRVEWPVLGWSLTRRLFLTVPWKYPPSTSAMRGAMTSPSSEPVARMSTFSRAVTRPVTEPPIVTILAQIRAVTLAVAPIVRTCAVSSIVPLTWPSRVRSSNEGTGDPGPPVPSVAYYMPPMPPMSPMPPAPPGIPASLFSSGISLTRASVVSSSPAIELAFCNAARTTLVGSTTPASIRFS